MNHKKKQSIRAKMNFHMEKAACGRPVAFSMFYLLMVPFAMLVPVSLSCN